MIILDLDGVLADFATAACHVHGHSGYKVAKWNFFEDWGIGLDEFWSVIHEEGDSFYKSWVQPYPWTMELVQLVDKADDWLIMSSPSNSHFGYSAKKIWIDKYLQPFFECPIGLIVGSEKHLLAKADRLLIDDYDSNIEKFRRAGGEAITFPQLWNSQSSVRPGTLNYIRNYLSFWRCHNDLRKQNRDENDQPERRSRNS